jgi:hypothetical protein
VILRAANDGALAGAVVDAAHGQFVRAGHGVAREDLRGDDAGEFAAELLDALDFQAEHGEPLGQFLGRPVEINVLFEPVKGDFHFKKKLNLLTQAELEKLFQKFNSLGFVP